MKSRKRFIEQLGEWTIGPDFGRELSWKKDLKSYIEQSDKVIKAIKFNTKLSKKLLAMSKKEQEAYWDKYG